MKYQRPIGVCRPNETPQGSSPTSRAMFMRPDGSHRPYSSCVPFDFEWHPSWTLRRGRLVRNTHDGPTGLVEV